MAGNNILIKQINQYSVEHRPFLLIVDFELNKPLLFPIDELPDDIFFHTPEFHSGPALQIKQSGHEFNPDHIPFETYQLAFRKIRAEALAGNTYLANLTFPTPIRTNLGLREIFQLSKARYKLLFRDEFLTRDFCPDKGRLYLYLPDERNHRCKSSRRS
ncbi:hypothetical protein ACFLTU_07625 [Bacteroidota bacterium]